MNNIALIRNFIVVVALMMALGGSARASVLTFTTAPGPGYYRWAHLFDGGTDGSPNSFADYGDRVTGAVQTGAGSSGTFTYSYGTAGGSTSNVVADYTGNDAGNDGSGYNYGTDIIIGGGFVSEPALLPYYPDLGTTKRRVVTLTADPGFTVSLEAFTIEDYVGSRHVAELDVIGINANNTTTPLWSASNPDAVFGSTSLTYTTNDFGGPLTYRALAIEFRETADNINYFAFDDIQFSQAEVIPEPGVIALLTVGGIVFWRRRK